jgi:hypothetical protein
MQAHVLLHQARRLVTPLGCQVLRLGPADAPPAVMAVYAGTGQNLEFLRRLFAPRGPAAKLAEVASPVGLAGAARRVLNDSDDLLLGDLPPAWAAVCGLPQDVAVPAWLRQQLTLPATGHLLPRHLRREVERLRRRFDYRVEFDDDPQRRAEFHDRHYRPHVAARFGPEAILVPRDYFLQRSASQTLARLYLDGQWVSGQLLAREGEMLRFGWYGARHESLPAGSSEVLDAACIEHARGLGLRQVVLGSTRPSRADGSYRYKAKFGAVPVATRLPETVLTVQVRRWSPAVVEALRAAALVGLRRGQPVAWDVVDAATGNARVAAQPLFDTGLVTP